MQCVHLAVKDKPVRTSRTCRLSCLHYVGWSECSQQIYIVQGFSQKVPNLDVHLWLRIGLYHTNCCCHGQCDSDRQHKAIRTGHNGDQSHDHKFLENLHPNVSALVFAAIFRDVKSMNSLDMESEMKTGHVSLQRRMLQIRPSQAAGVVLVKYTLRTK